MNERPARFDDEGDGMSIAALATLVTLLVIGIGIVMLFGLSMHRAGQGRLPW